MESLLQHEPGGREDGTAAPSVLATPEAWVTRVKYVQPPADAGGRAAELTRRRAQDVDSKASKARPASWRTTSRATLVRRAAQESAAHLRTGRAGAADGVNERVTREHVRYYVLERVAE